VVDGNFTAEHLHMRNPQDDVELTNGTGYFVGRHPYEQHIRETTEVKQVECGLYVFAEYPDVYDRSQRVPNTKQYPRSMRIIRIWNVQGWWLVPVPGMLVLYLIAWLICKRVNGA
jgi:hypothetical protein